MMHTPIRSCLRAVSTALFACLLTAQDTKEQARPTEPAEQQAGPQALPPADATHADDQAGRSSVIEVPIHQITRLHGVMDNTLTGIGLVTGLSSTGASDKASRQLMANYIRRYGKANITDADLTTGSWAMVHVTAKLPAFAKEGMQLDVTVSTIGDATALQGGRLITTFLEGLDGVIYATADGPVSVAGFAAQSQGTKVQRNFPTVGHLPGAGVVVRSIESRYLSAAGHLELGLVNPSLSTAQEIAIGINRLLNQKGCTAGVVDENLVRITLPARLRNESDAIQMLNAVRDVRVRVENPSTVMISEATGVVLAGEGVMISPCVIALGDLTITVVSEDEIVQPLPGINNGETARINRTRIDVASGGTELKKVAGGATVGELLANLKSLSLSPRQMVEVFEFLAMGRYLQARLVKV